MKQTTFLLFLSFFSLLPFNKAYYTTTTVGDSYTRFTEFIDSLTSLVIDNDTRAVHSSGGAAGGVVSEGQGYGLLIGGITSLALRSTEHFETVVTQTYQLFRGWKHMCILSVGSASCQDLDYYCGGGSYPCLPHWKFEDSLEGYAATGSAPDGDEDAILGMILLLLATESNYTSYSWWTTTAEWAYESCKQFYESSTEQGTGDYRILRLGACWGGWDCSNPSYHAPAAYRVMRNFMYRFGPILNHGTEGEDYYEKWNYVIETTYAVLLADQCNTTGLTTNWYVPNSDPYITGTTGCTGSGTTANQFGSEAARGIWRVTLDYLWFSEESNSSSTYLSRISSQVISKYDSSSRSFGDLDTGCLVASVFSDWQINAFIYGPLFTSLMYPEEDASEQQPILDRAGEIVANGTVDAYYGGSWTVISTLTLNGDILVAKSFVQADANVTIGNIPWPAPNTSPQPVIACAIGNPMYVFIGGFVGDFIGTYSWGDYSLDDPTYEFEDGPSLSLIIQNWNGLQIRCADGNCINTEEYNAFSFALNGGETGGQVVRVEVRQSDVIVGGQITVTGTANTWVEYTVFFAQLTTVNPLNCINFMDNTGSSSGTTIYVNNIQLVCASNTTSPEPSPPASPTTSTGLQNTIPLVYLIGCMTSLLLFK